MTLDQLNELSDAEARGVLARCCGAARWVGRMAASRPFADREQLFAASQQINRALEEDDWLEAFRHHPKIGDVGGLRARFQATAAWAGAEQAGAAAASEEVLSALAEGNRAYEERFGFIFIVCATGKPADEMLSLLQARLGNQRAEELAIAAGEQEKITRLRLEKLLENSP